MRLLPDLKNYHPSLPTTPDVVPVLEQVDDVVDVVSFLQPGIKIAAEIKLGLF